jgi:hypothetical protein
MSFESLELERVTIVRNYTAEEMLDGFAADPEAVSFAEPAMVTAFAKLCALQSINIYKVAPIDRQDIAYEARSFVSILNNLGHTATHALVPKPKGTLRFGDQQLKAKLRNHYASPDLDSTDAITEQRQLEKERHYIRLARINETYFPEVSLAHQLTRTLMDYGLEKAAWSGRDLIIAMGMSIEDILHRQRQLAVQAEERNKPHNPISTDPYGI